MFDFIKNNPKLTIYFDERFPNIDSTSFPGSSAEEFREQYQDAMEELPKDMPEPRGKLVTITAFLDAYNASDKRTKVSHKGYVIFVNRSPIIFYSKRQSTVDSSTFSSEFIAMKTCTAHIISLGFKLQMLGIEKASITA